jgi:predicted RND superfamily exporter protein
MDGLVVQVMSVFTFIANMGGMLGFAMGFSVICAIEVAYCLLIRYIN